MKFKGILTLARPNFLILSAILGLLGSSIAWYEHREFGGPFNPGYAFLATFGLIIAHAGVIFLTIISIPAANWIPERSGRPFSGGSGAIQSGLIFRKGALWTGIAP